MLKLDASLEAVKTRKSVMDDIVQTIVLNVFTEADQIGLLNAMYKKPLRITLEVKE